MARRARRYLGENLAFCLYDRTRNLVHTIEDVSATEIIDGRLSVDLAADPDASASEFRRQLRRLMLANATVYHAFQRMRGRSFTRAEILQIRSRQRTASPVSRRPAKLDAQTCLISGGLDWQYKDLRSLWSLKQVHEFRYCAIVYDLIPLIFPHFVAPGYDTLLIDYFGELVWLSDCSMCISEATRRDWLAHCGEYGINLPAHVFPLGSDPPAGKKSSADELPEALRGKRFGLFVSTIEPRKNHRVLYDAWDRCIRSQMVDPARDRLVFAGRRGWAVNDLLRELAANPATRDTIVVLNDVSDALLHVLNRHCALVLFPSFYEGYGLPLAEALGHGKLAISSNGGALSEIGGDMVLRIDPKDTIVWAEKIAHYLTSPGEVAAWEARIKTGYRPVTWDDAAQRFFGTIVEVVS